jgi:hypothetical protein
MYLITSCLQDYKKACGALLDGLKLEPENVEIEDGLRYTPCPLFFGYIQVWRTMTTSQ